MIMVAPGKFKMGRDDTRMPREVTKVHTVTITRPFWMSNTRITYGQLMAILDGGKPGQLNMPANGISYYRIEEYCEKLTKKFRRELPQGYVFRLPTEAEWEYALRKGETMESVAKLEVSKEIREEGKVKGWTVGGLVMDLHTPKTKSGIYGFGDQKELVYDTVSPQETGTGRGQFDEVKNTLLYSDNEIDPVRIFEGKDPQVIMRRIEGPLGFCSRMHTPKTVSAGLDSFRIVVAPTVSSLNVYPKK